MRENAESKATRLLSEGRVMVVRASPDRILALVRGDSAHIYRVEWIAGRWSCTCEALGRCSHGLAVQRVVVTESEGIQFALEEAVV